jgi:hypothetical protein
MLSDPFFLSGRRRFVSTLAGAAAALSLPSMGRGYSDSNIQAVLGGNFRRLLGSTWIDGQNKTGEKS